MLAKTITTNQEQAQVQEQNTNDYESLMFCINPNPDEDAAEARENARNNRILPPFMRDYVATLTVDGADYLYIDIYDSLGTIDGETEEEWNNRCDEVGKYLNGYTTNEIVDTFSYFASVDPGYCAFCADDIADSLERFGLANPTLARLIGEQVVRTSPLTIAEYNALEALFAWKLAENS